MRSGKGEPRSWSNHDGGAGETPEGNAFNRIATEGWAPRSTLVFLSVREPIPSALPGNDTRHDLVSCLRSWCENLIGVETHGSLPICKLGRNVTRQTSTDERPALTNRLHGS